MTQTPEWPVLPAEFVVGPGGMALLIPVDAGIPDSWAVTAGRVVAIDDQGRPIAALEGGEDVHDMLKSESVLTCITVGDEGPDDVRMLPRTRAQEGVLA